MAQMALRYLNPINLVLLWKTKLKLDNLLKLDGLYVQIWAGKVILTLQGCIVLNFQCLTNQSLCYEVLGKTKV